uniref:Uncharacterized protein n=1 Tax=Oryza sativa subsp. japonica TaxID=39947 RepID=Q75GY6_ORYSJ|nr:hypothetical protein [Oryza sativa Japonica Group]
MVYCVSGIGSRWTGCTAAVYGTNGRDRIDPPRVYGNGDDAVSGDVTTDDGSGSRARRRTTVRRRKRTAPTGSGRRGEPYRGTNSDGRQPDDDGDEDEAAATIGSTTTAVLRRSPATMKGRRRAKARVAAERGGPGGPSKGARGRRRRPTAAGDGEGKIRVRGENRIRFEIESGDFQRKLDDDSKREKEEGIPRIISPLLIRPEMERGDGIWKGSGGGSGGWDAAGRREEDDSPDRWAPPVSGRESASGRLRADLGRGEREEGFRAKGKRGL